MQSEILIREGAVVLKPTKNDSPQVKEIIKCLRSFRVKEHVEIRDGVVIAAITKNGYELRSYNLNEHLFFATCEPRGIAPRSFSTVGCEGRILVETSRTYPLEEVELTPDNLKIILKQIIDIIVALDHLKLYYSDCRIAGFRYIRPDSLPPKVVITNMSDITMANGSKMKNMLKTLFISIGFESSKDNPNHPGMLELEQMVKTLIDLPDSYRPYSCDAIKAIIEDW